MFGKTKAKRMADSLTVMSLLMKPNDANHLGNVHGGVILKLMDEAAYVCCAKHCAQDCVTASFERVDFLAPIKVSDVVTITAVLNFVGRTSMEVGIEVEALDPQTGKRQKTHSSLVTMVAINKKGQPVAVPPLVHETEEEKRRFEQGKARYEARRAQRN